MAFELARDGKGGAFWSLLMSIILAINYASSLNVYMRSILIASVPASILGLMKSAYFVNPKPLILLLTTAMTFFYLLIIQISPRVRESMKDPKSHKVISGISYGSVSIFFGIMFVIISKMSGGAYNMS